MEIGFNGHPPSMPAFHRAHWEYYATLHERLVGPAPAYDFNELWELIHAHRGYMMNRPDNGWYYNTIPTYTGTASFVRNQDSFLAMFFLFFVRVTLFCQHFSYLWIFQTNQDCKISLEVETFCDIWNTTAMNKMSQLRS